LPQKTRIKLCFFLGFLWGALVPCKAQNQETLRPRKALTPPGLVLQEGSEHRLTVKFRDEVKARSQADGNIASKTGMLVSSMAPLRSKYRLRFRPLIDLPEEKLAAFEARAAQRSGKSQPDLAGMMIVDVPGATEELLVAVGEELQALELVEYAYIEVLYQPPPGDIPPPTPDLTVFQTYFDSDPGMDVDYAWSVGYDGFGVRLSDCEYGWVYTHEDLMDKNLNPEPGQTPHPDVESNNWDEHGTAVMGQLCAVVNGYGVSGMVPNAAIYTYPEWTVEGGYRRVTCITNALADSAAGDVVLLEMQNGLAPAETDPNVHSAVSTGVNAGVVVVAAAGNGGHDLDEVAYQTYRSWGDSGAIIVGGGTSDANHDHHPNSTYGSRVNMQGWYVDVFTLGYGQYAEYGGDKNQRYIATFSGTSAASPFVAAACVIIQDKAQDYGRRLTPWEMRQILVKTGIPQGSGGHVGPFPDLRAALNLTEKFARGTWVDFLYSGVENGTFEKPYNTLAEGVAAAISGGYVFVKAGTSSETITIMKDVTIMSWGGTVIVGH